MVDLGFDKMAVIGVVALLVIGPERLPRVARTVGNLLGRAQRYVADVKAEVNRSIELEELQKMKSSVENAASDLQSSIHNVTSEVQSTLNEVSAGLTDSNSWLNDLPPVYKHPGKKWRIKRGAVPTWYKARHGVRAKAASGAARVARFRPR
jgi:sec-independent protein translocase protein TatB